MSITHTVGPHKFTVETYWLKERGPGAFQLVYSIDGVKVTKEQFIHGLSDAIDWRQPDPAQPELEVPGDPNLRTDDGGTESD